MGGPVGAAALLPPTLALGPVHLNVTDVSRSANWYERTVGMYPRGSGPGFVELGDDGRTVVVVHEDGYRARVGHHAGLYHYALLFPKRVDLARAARRLRRTGAPVQGLVDHGTHEAIYLADADGLGIELAWDRPRAAWPPLLEMYARGPSPLDVPGLMSLVDDDSDDRHVARGVRIGHVHLHVGDLRRGLGYYCDALGFALQALIHSAAFVSAGGYHHHLGMNTWEGEGVSGTPPDSVGLRRWDLQLDSTDEVAEVCRRLESHGFGVEPRGDGFLSRDPWGTALAVTVARR